MSLQDGPATATDSPVPYGQACTVCSRAKCKCVPRGLGQPCERCVRLNKECQPSVGVRKRASRRQGKTGLEEKLEDLVTLLKNQSRGLDFAGPSTLNTQPYAQATQFDIVPDLRNPIQRSGDPLTSGLSNGHGDLLTPASTSAQPAADSSPAPIPNEPTPLEAEEYLTVFREKYVPWFPFTLIPHTTTSKQLRQERPFLWLCIMTLTTKSLAQQQILILRIRDVAAQRIVVQQERDPDLLQGLVAFLAWPVCQIRGRPFMNLCSHLARVLVSDCFHLDKLARSEPGPSFRGQLDIRTGMRVAGPTCKIWTMEARRAVLACYANSCMVTLFLQSKDSMPWVPALDECLTIISESQESPNDAILASVVRIQRLAHEVGQTHWKPGDPSPNEASAPPALYADAFQYKLRQIERSIAELPHASQHTGVRLHLLSTDILIRDLAFGPIKFPSPPQPDIRRIESLWQCLEAIKAFFDLFREVFATEGCTFSFAYFVHLAIGFQALYRLSTLDEPGWDRALVRGKIDILEVMDEIANSLAEVPERIGLRNETGDRDPYMGAATVLRGMRAACLPALQSLQVDTTTMPQPTLDQTDDFQQLLDSMDDTWMAGIFSV